MTKQEKIQEAWIEVQSHINAEGVPHYNEDGWAKYGGKQKSEYFKTLEEKQWLGYFFYRPKSLEGIEVNNGCELDDVFIRVFCGVSIEDKCRHQLHPLNEVIQAQNALSLNKSMDFYSNSTDFVSAIKYLCQDKSINCEFFLNGESTGNDIEPIFENFNKSFSLLNELCPNIT